MSKYGWCEVMLRDHRLGDFHSVQIPNSTIHTEMCVHCGKRPGQ